MLPIYPLDLYPPDVKYLLGMLKITNSDREKALLRLAVQGQRPKLFFYFFSIFLQASCKTQTVDDCAICQTGHETAAVR